MGSIIAQILLAGVKWVLSYFTPSNDERLGRAEVTVDAQNKELKNVEVKKHIDDVVDRGDIKRLSNDLDSADK